MLSDDFADIMIFRFIKNVTTKRMRSCLNELRKLLFQNDYPAGVIIQH